MASDDQSCGRDLYELATTCDTASEFIDDMREVVPPGPANAAWRAGLRRLYKDLRASVKRPQLEASQGFPLHMLEFAVLRLDGSVRSTGLRQVAAAGEEQRLGDFVAKVEEMDEGYRGVVNTVDASRLGVYMEQDVQLLGDLVHVLPNCHILDLSINRLSVHAGPWVQELLDKCEQLEFVIITGNPLASVDAKEWWQSLTDDHVKRLVWVPKAWLRAGHWKNVCSRDAVEIAHAEFYARVE